MHRTFFSPSAETVASRYEGTLRPSTDTLSSFLDGTASGTSSNVPSRVLLVASEAPPIVSGVSRTIDRLSDALRALGTDVDVISSNDIRRWTFGEVRVSSFVTRWPLVSRRLRAYDIVNVHGPAPTMSDGFLALFRSQSDLTRPALVYTHHSSIDLAGIGPLCRLYDGMTARLASVADRIVVTTTSYADQIRRPGGPPVDTVPWGVDAHLGPRTPREAGQPLRVLFVGQLRPYKGVSVLLNAAAGRPELRVTIVGAGALEASLRQEASGLGASNVTFTGRVSDQELRRLYGEHDVIVLPSTTRAEAFGLVLLEGMAAGCVPVASDLPGVREVAGPTGVLTRPGDPSELREVLLALARDQGRVDRLGSASRGAALKMPWSSVGRAYATAYQRAIRDANEGRAQSVLRIPFLAPELTLQTLADRFEASWSSLMIFNEGGRRRLPIAWGRAAQDEYRDRAPGIAAYVARNRRPMLLHGGAGGGDVASLMNRDDVASAMALPISMRRGAVGVLSVSRAHGMTRPYGPRDLAELTRQIAS